MKRQVFHVLDGMRGVAALAVVERHKPDFLFGTALPASYLAVDLFFMLSGFVIAHAYEQRLRDGLSVVRFTLLRLDPPDAALSGGDPFQRRTGRCPCDAG
ncbi:MAG: acyltransferase [Phyllobacteriaceae bacterium]|nr:acyltransferase [Phyllobacteriaceae bacterium]